ncbi:hypothetical protein ACFQY7_22180 [Actinomadura luteofluorescens]
MRPRPAAGRPAGRGEPEKPPSSPEGLVYRYDCAAPAATVLLAMPET